jgi:hypothetical protein
MITIVQDRLNSFGYKKNFSVKRPELRQRVTLVITCCINFEKKGLGNGPQVHVRIFDRRNIKIIFILITGD